MVRLVKWPGVFQCKFLKSWLPISLTSLKYLGIICLVATLCNWTCNLVLPLFFYLEHRESGWSLRKGRERMSGRTFLNKMRVMWGKVRKLLRVMWSFHKKQMREYFHFRVWHFYWRELKQVIKEWSMSLCTINAMRIVWKWNLITWA